MSAEDIGGVLNEQLRYYREGAAEYDAANRRMLVPQDAEWWPIYRAGYDSAVALTEVEAADRDVLELAGGSGLYTAVLARTASRLTVLDGSPEALSINRQHMAFLRPDIDYIQADIFDWRSARSFEVVFFAFWLCHVPLARFQEFWATVDLALAPRGTVVVVDTVASVRGGAVESPSAREELFPERRISSETSVRSLSNGAEYSIVRILWEREDLTAALAELGWVARFDETSPWLVGTVRRA